MKTCSICGEEKLNSGFRRCSRNGDGLQAACKDCQKANRVPSTRGVPIDMEGWDVAARCATKPMREADTYWQTMGLWMMGEIDARPVD